MTAPWRWVLLDDGGRTLRTSEGFEERADAEVWLSNVWRDLAEEGAHEVALVEGGREVYRMGLGEA